VSFLENDLIRKAWREEVTGVRRSGRFETVLRVAVFFWKSSGKGKESDFGEMGKCVSFPYRPAGGSPLPPPILALQAPLACAAGGEGNPPRIGETPKTRILRMSLFSDSGTAERLRT